MDEHSLEVLELGAIRELLADETEFAGGRALAEALAPSIDAGTVARLQAETAEAVLLVSGSPPRLAGAHDVRPAVELAARGGVLQPDVLQAIAETVATAVGARGALHDREDVPLLRVAMSVVPTGLASLADRIDAAVEPDGTRLRDRASPQLGRLRREMAAARRRAAERLREEATRLRSHLQEEFVTERGGRPVLAVKASARSAVPGIVHDTSGSGQTLFVEPFAVVEAQNEIRELEALEREEVERILAELSALVRVAAPEVVVAVGALAHLDVTLARAALSARWRGCPVEIAEDVELLQARHPLLDPSRAVPIDLPLTGIRCVVVSGPNTGGKTVGLKTLGLAALVHQCGLRPPAARARLPVFDAVLADIGDEQSIAMSLSTFSGHMRNLVHILEAAGPRSLVLLDEVAAGTDPHEGAALARGIVAALVDRGAHVVVTTHYSELKEWASEAEGVVNAAVGFDPDSLQPTFVLAVGRAGASHALQMAEQLGLEPTVVSAARQLVAPERLAVAGLLAEAAGAERDAAAALDRARAAQLAAEASLADADCRERELREALDAVRAGAKSERDRARAEAEQQLADYRRELAALREEIREARRQERLREQAPAPVAGDAERERDRMLDQASKRTRRAAARLDAVLVESPVPRTAPLAVGDPVVAPSLGARGTIIEISGDQAELQAGSARLRVPLALLEPDPRGGITRDAPERPVNVRVAAPTGVPHSIDVRGQTAADAREAVRRFIDQAHLAGLADVEVIHGRGTGAVRKAVRDELARHPLVAATETASADGATLVRFAAAGD